MGIDIHQAYRSGESRQAISKKLEEAGVEVKPQDLSLLIMLHTTAHEAGHMIQGGINSYLPQQADENFRPVIDVDATAKHMLVTNPEFGQTGNLETDARILNERFAEGYGLIVLSRAAELLGYDVRTIQALVEATKNPEDVYESLQHMQEVTADKSLHAVLKEKGSDAYDGEAGYTMPLTPEQLVVELERVDELLRSPDKTLPDAQKYAQDFGLHRVNEQQEIFPAETPDKIHRRSRMVRIFKGKLRKSI
jgi:hypothetical protein